MKAKDIMTTSVVTVSPDTPVTEIAQVLNKRRISAVPVVDDAGGMLGMVSEGDLIQRPEVGGERHTSWWLSLISGPTETAERYVKAHGGVAQDIMSRTVISSNEQASLAELARLLEVNRIKRVPILRDQKLVGIVSRADLLHGVIGLEQASEATDDDRTVRSSIEAEIRKAGVQSQYIKVIVVAGVVDLWGMVLHDVEMTASRVAVEQVSGVKRLNNHLTVMPPDVQALMGAE
tara:strand:+ start:240 stop:938 length:699 start_codon:yes stop_codon:yes gene_type:complete